MTRRLTAFAVSPWTNVLAIVIITLLTTNARAQAPDAWSHGIQDLRITYDECRQRADAALRAEGFSVDMKSGAWTGGARGVSRASILCYGNSTGGTGVAIFIASNTDDSNVPGAERVRLQQQMDKAARRTGLAGVWTYAGNCAEGPFGGQLDLGNLTPEGSFSGRFMNVNETDVGSISGFVQGNRIEFVRKATYRGTYFEQTWFATFTSDTMSNGRIVRPTEGKQDCTFTANLK